MNIQTFLVIGSLATLTYAILNINNKIGIQTTWEMNNEAIISGTAIGQSVLEEIKLKAFDAKTISTIVSNPDDLTSSSSLGKESGESNPSNFNDVDDFNQYIQKDTLSRLGIFSTRVEVYYVQTMSPGTRSTNRTFSKRIDVFVTNNYLLDKLIFTNVSSY